MSYCGISCYVYINSDNVIHYLEENNYEINTLGYYLKKYYGYANYRSITKDLNLGPGVLSVKLALNDTTRAQFFSALEGFVNMLTEGTVIRSYYYSRQKHYGCEVLGCVGDNYEPLSHYRADYIVRKDIRQIIREQVTKSK